MFHKDTHNERPIMPLPVGMATEPTIGVTLPVYATDSEVLAYHQEKDDPGAYIRLGEDDPWLSEFYARGIDIMTRDGIRIDTYLVRVIDMYV